MPTHEEPNESPAEQGKRRIAKLEELIRINEDIATRHENESKEFVELHIIIDGLYERARTLTEEHLTKLAEMPNTDEGWDELIQRASRIEDIYARIESLEKELETTERNIAGIESELDEIVKQFEE